MSPAVVVSEMSTVESVARDLCALDHPGLMGLCEENLALAARCIAVRDCALSCAAHLSGRGDT